MKKKKKKNTCTMKACRHLGQILGYKTAAHILSIQSLHTMSSYFMQVSRFVFRSLRVIARVWRFIRCYRAYPLQQLPLLLLFYLEYTLLTSRLVEINSGKKQEYTQYQENNVKISRTQEPVISILRFLEINQKNTGQIYKLVVTQYFHFQNSLSTNRFCY